MIRLFDRPWKEARALVATGAPVHLAINPVEYHGPHLSLHNDRLVSHGLIGDLHARIHADHPDWELLVADDLELGVEPAAGIGSRYVPYPVAKRQIVEACRALAQLGAKRVILHTFHGNPLHNQAIQAGVDWLRGAGIPVCAPFHLIVATQLALEPENYRPAVAHLAQDDADRLLGKLRFDFHAGFFETSMALVYAPDSVWSGHTGLPPCPSWAEDRAMATAARAMRAVGATQVAAELEFAAAGTGWGRMRPYYGYCSEPAFANAVSGRVFADAILDRYVPLVEGVMMRGEAPPRAIFGWLPWVSMGGRLILEGRPSEGEVFSG